MGQVKVLVKHKEFEEQQIITYHAYKDTQYAYDLIGEVNDKGELVPGDPNLEPRHRKAANVADRVVNGVEKVIEPVNYDEQIKETVEQPNLPKKRGPKPKLAEV